MSESSVSRPTQQLFRGRIPWVHVATHEAGHAVIGLVSGMPVKRVALHAIAPSPPDGLALGGVEFDTTDNSVISLVKSHPTEMAVVLLAGAAAEERLLGGYLHGGWSEDVRIMRIGLGLVDSCNTWVNNERDLVVNLVRQSRTLVDRNVDVIGKVATTLLHKRALTVAEIASLFDCSDAR